jgi:hypothetical protein
VEVTVSDALWMLLAFVGVPALFVLRVVLASRRRNPQRLRGASEQARVFDGGLRLVSGEEPGLTRKWRTGRVVVEPGLLTLRPYKLGLKFLHAEPVTVAVAGVDPDGAQHAGLKDELSVAPGSRLFPVRTTTGATVQLALRTSRTDEVFAALSAGPAPV